MGCFLERVAEDKRLREGGNSSTEGLSLCEGDDDDKTVAAGLPFSLAD